MTAWSDRRERDINQQDEQPSLPEYYPDLGPDLDPSNPRDAWLLDVPTPTPVQQRPSVNVSPETPTLPTLTSRPTHAMSASRPGAPLLELQNVTITYGQIAAVRNLSLEVGQGELVALLGANGAGKTTTLRTISGLQRPRAGNIFFAGQRIDRMGSEKIARLGIAHLPEGRGMFPRLSVDENFRMAAYGAGVPMGEYNARLDSALELFPVLRERMSQLAGTLSGGQQQMLAVARALVTRPRLLMIDELSFGLAPVVVKQLFALLPTILASGTSILLVEQFVGQALAVAARAYVLEKGEVSYAGSAVELSQREGFVESSYLGAGAKRPEYQRTRSQETEMLRVRIEPSMLRRLRAAGNGRTMHEMANEALRNYLAASEAAHGQPAPEPNTAPSEAHRYDYPPLEEQRGGPR